MLGILQFLRRPAKAAQVGNTLTISRINNQQAICKWQVDNQIGEKIKNKVYETCAILLTDETIVKNKQCKPTAIQVINIDISAQTTTLQLPINDGLLCLSLACKDKDGNWIIIATRNLDLGPRREVDRYTDMPNASEPYNIHQLMYDLACKNQKIGGSEQVKLNDQPVERLQSKKTND